MLDARFSHLYFCHNLNRLQRGLSAISELLVKNNKRLHAHDCAPLPCSVHGTTQNSPSYPSENHGCGEMGRIYWAPAESDEELGANLHSCKNSIWCIEMDVNTNPAARPTSSHRLTLSNRCPRVRGLGGPNDARAAYTQLVFSDWANVDFSSFINVR